MFEVKAQEVRVTVDDEMYIPPPCPDPEYPSDPDPPAVFEVKAQEVRVTVDE